MFRDYGAGLSIDELIGMQAQDIASLSLPNEEAFERLKSAARTLCDHDQERAILMEVWGEGGTVWMGGEGGSLLVRPSGQLWQHDPGPSGDE